MQERDNEFYRKYVTNNKKRRGKERGRGKADRVFPGHFVFRWSRILLLAKKKSPASKYVRVYKSVHDNHRASPK